MMPTIVYIPLAVWVVCWCVFAVFELTYVRRHGFYWMGRRVTVWCTHAERLQRVRLGVSSGSGGIWWTDNAGKGCCDIDKISVATYGVDWCWGWKGTEVEALKVSRALL